jgi:osmotically inducible protein OsmC
LLKEKFFMSLKNVVYRGCALATGGRDGHAVIGDSKLDLKLDRPRELGGPGGQGTNPEQLFAAGYSACFISSMKYVAERDHLQMPADAEVQGSVAVGGALPEGFEIEVELRVSLPDMERPLAQMLIEKAHAECPYSKATRNNIGVKLTLI